MSISSETIDTILVTVQSAAAQLAAGKAEKPGIRPFAIGKLSLASWPDRFTDNSGGYLFFHTKQCLSIHSISGNGRRPVKKIPAYFQRVCDILLLSIWIASYLWNAGNFFAFFRKTY